DLTPTTAQIYLDGALIKGLLVQNLPEGEHLVAVRAPGYKDYVASKFVVAGENQLAIKLEQTVSANLSGYFTPVRSAYDLPQEVVGFIDNMCIQLNGAII